MSLIALQDERITSMAGTLLNLVQSVLKMLKTPLTNFIVGSETLPNIRAVRLYYYPCHLLRNPVVCF